jgi:cyclic pyranopterin phosphate synthase
MFSILSEREIASMLVDRYGRRITYLRISVTDRCNYRCTYCMPETGIELMPHSCMLRYEEIAKVAQIAGTLGITKIRFTGGEPLVKKGIENLVRLVADSWHFEDLCMTTNGSLLTRELAHSLRDAGLNRVNISLDTLDPSRFASITRGGNLNDVVAGIEAARNAGLSPIKINMVVLDNTTDDEIQRMRSFCERQGLVFQTIARFSLENRERRQTMKTHRPPDCSACNRLRLTADGYLKPCLFSDNEVKVDFLDIEGSIKAAVAAKPLCGIRCRARSMSQIGG